MDPDKAENTTFVNNFPAKNQKTIRILAVVIFVLAILVTVFGYLSIKGLVTDISCGGFAGVRCPQGYWCQIPGKNPDALGKCVKDIFGRESSLTPVAKPTIIFTPTQEPTLDWITYTDKTNKFEIKYPSKFIPLAGKLGQYIFALEDSSNSKQRLSTLPDIFVRVLTLPAAQDYQKILLKDVVFDGSGLRPKFFSEFIPITLGENNFYYIQTGLFEGILSGNYYLVSDNKIYVFSYASSPVDWTNPDYKTDDDSLNRDLQQTLSTFKFLDLTTVTPTINPEGRFCGGIAANLPENQCPTGYRCQLDGSYPDAGGVCVKQ